MLRLSLHQSSFYSVENTGQDCHNYLTHGFRKTFVRLFDVMKNKRGNKRSAKTKKLTFNHTS